jgi:hypothetical protein
MAADGGEPSEYHGNLTGQKFIDACRQLERNNKYFVEQRGIWRLYWLIYCAIHGIDPNTGAYNSNQELRVLGKDAMYASFRVQMTRRFIQQRIMMVKDQRPSFEGVATQNDTMSLAQVNIATRAIEYAMTEAHLEREASGGLESLGNYGGSALWSDWDFDGGDLMDVQEPETDQDGNPVQMPVLDPQTQEPMPQLDETGQPMLDEQGLPVMQQRTPMQTVKKRSGAPKVSKLYPWQRVVDTYMEHDHEWTIIKIPINKHVYAARFPEKAKEILACGIDDEMGDDALFAWGGRNSVSSDVAVLRIYYHENSAAVPGGRYAAYLGKNVGLWGVDQPMPCPLDKGIPVRPMIGARYHGTSVGYPESGDLLSLQTALNEIVSIGLTNFQKRGLSNAYVDENVQIDARKWSQGNHLHPLGPGQEPPTWDEPPEVGSLAQYMLEFIREELQQMLGSNSVTNGNPDANITSGSFAVLLVNIAQKYASQMQEAYDTCITECANDCLELMQKYAIHGFRAEIAGIANDPYVQIMNQDDFASIRRVKIKRKNPVLSTYMGRRDLFDATKDLPPQQRAAATEMLLESDMEAWADNDQSSAIRIRKENELMLQGIEVQVGITDDHAAEGPKHRATLDKLRTMDPPKTGSRAFQLWQTAKMLLENHIIGHSVQLGTTPPMLALTCGWAPLAMPAPDAENDQGGDQPGAAGGGGNAAGKPPKPPKQPQAPETPAGAQGTIAGNAA